MGRKTTTVTITEGRDSGKKFLLTEPSCNKIHDMVMRAVFGLGSAGVEFSPEILELGAAPAAYAIASQFSKLPSELGIKLADELMEGVQRSEEKLTRSLVDADIEEASTRFRLEGEMLKLIFGFFAFAAYQSSAAPVSGTPSSKP